MAQFTRSSAEQREAWVRAQFENCPKIAAVGPEAWLQEERQQACPTLGKGSPWCWVLHKATFDCYDASRTWLSQLFQERFNPWIVLSRYGDRARESADFAGKILPEYMGGRNADIRGIFPLFDVTRARAFLAFQEGPIVVQKARKKGRMPPTFCFRAEQSMGDW